MKSRLAVVFVFVSSCLFGAGSVEWSGRAPHPAVVNPVCGYPDGTVVDLGGEWEFSANAASADRSQFFRRKQHEKVWKDARKIRVPGNWEAQGVGEVAEKQERRTYDGYRELPLRHYFNGNGWYRRTISVPADWKSRRIWLKVGGVGCQGWFWVAGKPVANVFDYCATRKFEITDLVTPGSDVEIVAEVSNATASKHGHRDSCCIWGGLTRTLELEATPQAFIDDAWCRGDFDAHAAHVHVAVEGGAKSRSCEVRATIDGESAIQTIKQTYKQSNNSYSSPPLLPPLVT